MIQSFIIALREGVEAALVIAIALAYLRKAGREDLTSAVYRALAAAVVSSLAGAWLLPKLNWGEDAFEGWMLLIASVFVFSMVVWMWRHSRGIKAEIERKLGDLATHSKRAVIGVFLFVFLMVFREGVETVLLLTAVNFNTDSLLEGAGLTAGLACAVAFGITFIRGTVRIDLRRFFRLTSAILVVIVLQLAITGLHELSEGGVLPSSSREMALVGPIVRNEVFFFVTVLSLAACMVLLDWGRRQPSAALPPEGASRRKALWTARRERLWMTAVWTASFIFIVMMTAEFIYAKASTELSPAVPLTASNGQVRIPVSSVSDGQLHRFSYSVEGATVRLIVIQKPDRTLAVAFDACVICGSQGYYQKGQQVLCRNCGSAIYVPSIGMAGGCNPVALRSHVAGGDLVIDTADLALGAKHFRSAPSST